MLYATKSLENHQVVTLEKRVKILQCSSKYRRRGMNRPRREPGAPERYSIITMYITTRLKRYRGYT